MVLYVVVVVVTDLSYFSGGSSVIKCRDGSKKFDKARINDEFCDCPGDGTDEPGISSFVVFGFFLCMFVVVCLIRGLGIFCAGTSACPNGKFYCGNAGHVPVILFSSRVNDGICGKASPLALLLFCCLRVSFILVV